jgi:hypothetical protein
MPEFARDDLKHTIVHMMIATGECSMNAISDEIYRTIVLAHPEDPLTHWWLGITREDVVALECEIFAEVFEALYPF